MCWRRLSQRGGKPCLSGRVRAPHRITPAAAAGHMSQMGVTETRGQSPPFLPATAAGPVPASVGACARLQAGGMPGAADAAIAARTVSFMQGILSGVCHRTPHGIRRVAQYCAGDARQGRPTPLRAGLQVDGLGVLRGQKRTANQTGLIACSAHPVGGGAHGAEWREPHARRSLMASCAKSRHQRRAHLRKRNRRRTSRSPPAANWPIS